MSYRKHDVASVVWWLTVWAKNYAFNSNNRIQAWEIAGDLDDRLLKGTEFKDLML